MFKKNPDDAVVKLQEMVAIQRTPELDGGGRGCTREIKGRELGSLELEQIQSLHDRYSMQLHSLWQERSAGEAGSRNAQIAIQEGEKTRDHVTSELHAGLADLHAGLAQSVANETTRGVVDALARTQVPA